MSDRDQFHFILLLIKVVSLSYLSPSKIRRELFVADLMIADQMFFYIDYKCLRELRNQSWLATLALDGRATAGVGGATDGSGWKFAP